MKLRQRFQDTWLLCIFIPAAVLGTLGLLAALWIYFFIPLFFSLMEIFAS